MLARNALYTLLASTARYGWLALAGMMAVGLTTGCAGLPKDVSRPVSVALVSPERTALGQLVAERRAADGARNASGFLLLSGPQAAYGSRLALVNAAQRTLDLQYYAIHADASSERLLLSVVDAARRGVRVRVLLDDFHSTGRDAQVMRLAFVPNIEMRMFNPLTGARASQLGRMLNVVTDFSRVQQRMHNKLFIADNAMGVTGGRNLGDAYFGHADTGNFVDLDVLAAGPVVQELSRSFDSYWNNERAYPVQALVTRQELDAMRAQLAPRNTGDPQGATPVRAGPGQRTVAPAGPALEPTSAPDAAALQRARVWDQQPMDLSQARFTWAPAAVLADKPAKIPTDNHGAGSSLADAPASASQGEGSTAEDGRPDGAPARKATSPTPGAAAAGTAAVQDAPTAPTAIAPLPKAVVSPSQTALPAPARRLLQRGSVKAPETSPLANAGTPEQAQNGDTVVDGLLQLMGYARRDLLIVSPYFVPGPDMKKAFADARARGVRVRVLTNSLASNDAPIAHAGYARHRPDLLAMGVELFEMRSELPAELRGSFGSTGSMGSSGSKARSDADGGGPGASRAMLHSKLLVLDGRLLAVGSMNLDIRSQRQNTEIALLIRSQSLSARAAGQIETALKTAAWRVELDNSGNRLVWRAPEGSRLPDATTEPDASLPLRLMLMLLGPLAPDHLL
ncbi:phospholipase D-like domain-containing protein [Acidovorax sp. RAC01]|uniref:phospholipase D-like domain-containing protein n=1 Tax=Acidovorax sp. RAC01 TaxID=1842533 RepID=UPI00083E939F|nr:phospholipase D family protein [Acidovorax sp. RAC01]